MPNGGQSKGQNQRIRHTQSATNPSRSRPCNSPDPAWFMRQRPSHATVLVCVPYNPSCGEVIE